MLNRREMLAALSALATPAVGADLKAGQLLVATPASRDPDFRETVVLLIHYDRRGAVGLMLNRPTKIAIPDLLPQAASVEGYAWAGGPVPLGITGLLRAENPTEQGIRLLSKVILITDRRSVAKLAKSARDASTFRVYAGNCGWSVQQLDEEMRRGLWTTRDASADVVFNRDPEKLWSTLARR
jgi:putative transcriptional regulator